MSPELDPQQYMSDPVTKFNPPRITTRRGRFCAAKLLHGILFKFGNGSRLLTWLLVLNACAESALVRCPWPCRGGYLLAAS